MIDDTERSEPGAEAPADEKSGFGEAFAERIAQGDDTTAKPSAEEREEPEGKPKGDESQGSDDDPAARAAEAEAPAEGTSGPPAKADPWEGLTPEQRTRLNKLQASERSQRGRVGALTKKLNASTAAVPVQAGETPKEGEQQPPEGGDTSTETATDRLSRLEAAARDYPESIGPAAEVIAELRKEMEALKATTSKQATDADAAEIAESLKALEDAHGDYEALAADKDFLAWLGDQPEAVVALANSWNPREVSAVLTLFKAEKAAAEPNDAAPKPEGEGGESATDAKRRRQLEGSRDTPSRGAPAAAGVPDDFAAAFAARMRQHAEADQAT